MSDAKKAQLSLAQANANRKAKGLPPLPAQVATQGLGTIFGVPVEAVLFGAAVVAAIAIVRRIRKK